MAGGAASPRPPSFVVTGDRDPWTYFRELADVGEVVWDDELQAWLVLSYEACKEVLRGDEARFAAPTVSKEYLAISGASKVSNLRGDAHARNHAWWMRVFSPTAIDARRETIRAIAHEAIDRFAPAGRAELSTELASRVSPRVIAAYMGLPWDDDVFIAAFMDGLERQMRWLDGQYDDADGALMRDAMAAAADMKELVLPFVRARYERGEDDIITRLIAEGPSLLEDWTEQQTLENVYATFFSGSDTTASAMDNALFLLLSRPDLAAELRKADVKTFANFVEEVLRLYGVLQFRPRIATADCELAGASIGKGDKLLVMFQAASRDGQHYQHAGEVDLAREAPRDHLAFAFGPRTCVGMGLARAELHEVLRVLLERLPDLAFDPQLPPPRYLGFIFRSYSPLHVVFTPSEPA